MADGESLGAPACTAEQNVYLKTVYACVDKNTMKPHYSQLGEDGHQGVTYDDDHDGTDEYDLHNSNNGWDDIDSATNGYEEEKEEMMGDLGMLQPK